MVSGAGKSSAFFFLMLNLLLYFIVSVISAWAMNYGVERTYTTASALSIPVRIFPLYFPFGNMATGFFVIFALIAGVVGFITSLTGIIDTLKWDSANLHTAAASSLMSWLITLLAMGLALKEIDLGWTDANLRTLETLLIILSGTQVVCVGSIQVGVGDFARQRILEGRV